MKNIETAKMLGGLQKIMAEVDPKAKERLAADFVTRYGDTVMDIIEEQSKFSNAPTRQMRTKALRVFDGVWFEIERRNNLPSFANGYYDLIRRCIAIEEDVNDRPRNN